MYVIRKKMKFEAAHRLMSAESKCCVDCIHGHNYVVEFFFRGKTLNKHAMVIDFGVVKKSLQSWINKWDHSLFLHAQDPLANPSTILLSQNPTAEVLAKIFFDKVKELIPETWKVRIHETDTGYAEYEED